MHIELPVVPESVKVYGIGRGLMDLAPVETMFVLDRLCAKSERRGDCWVWTKYTKQGYGSISIRNSDVYIHSFGLALKLGEVPEGKEACHTCDVRPCWNLDHLFAGTHQENVRDCINKGRSVSPPVASGLANKKASLTHREVEEIRAAWAKGDVQQRDLADAFGVSQSTIWRLIHHRTRTVA